MTMVDRYKAVVANVSATAHMAAHPDGEYVKFADYEALRCRIANLESTLMLIATPRRPDGTLNRDRMACYRLAKEELEAK